MFAVIGAYFMLYGVPSADPRVSGLWSVWQFAILAAIWMAIQMAFVLAGGVSKRR